MSLGKAFRWAVLSLLCGGTLLSASCGDIAINSVKNGLLYFIGSGVITTLSNSAFVSTLTTKTGT